MSADDERSLASLEHLTPPLDFSSPFDGDEFAALLVLRTEVSVEDRTTLSETLVREGCRHAVLCGDDCGEWEAAFDEASAVGAAGFRAPEGRLVMATSQEDEALEDVVDFFFDDTSFESFSPENFVVIVIGGTDDDVEEVQSALDHRAGHLDED